MKSLFPHAHFYRRDTLEMQAKPKNCQECAKGPLILMYTERYNLRRAPTCALPIREEDRRRTCSSTPGRRCTLSQTSKSLKTQTVTITSCWCCHNSVVLSQECRAVTRMSCHRESLSEHCDARTSFASFLLCAKKFTESRYRCPGRTPRPQSIPLRFRG